jgi:hypothetical protein
MQHVTINAATATSILTRNILEPTYQARGTAHPHRKVYITSLAIADTDNANEKRSAVAMQWGCLPHGHRSPSIDQVPFHNFFVKILEAIPVGSALVAAAH